MELVKLSIGALKPYENNPRYNDDAVEAVKESIRQCEYVSPIILDENNVILAGHTRFQALFELGVDEVECIVVKGLTDEQKRKFRLLDNKTAEIAEWDYDMLVAELDGLDLGDFSYFSKEVDKAASNLIKEHETGSDVPGVDAEEEIIYCPRCGKPINGLIDIDALEVDDEEVSEDDF